MPFDRPVDPQTPVRVSVTFTWDLATGYRLQKSWARFYRDVQVGGPALGDSGGEFVPGRFIKEGVTITSRGCPRRCPWCVVPQREGPIRELKIQPGHIVQDNNLLACSYRHIINVFEMLRRQKEQAVFSGGLDARLFQPWHRDLLDTIRFKELWFAADTDASIDRLFYVSDNLLTGISIEKKRCYVLIGHDGESIYTAEDRLQDVYRAGFLPFTQLYRGEQPKQWAADWKALQRKWSRPAAYRDKRAEEAVT